MTMKKNDKSIDNKHLTHKQIKDTGSIYTPSSLVEQMLGYITEEQWKEPDRYFIEPCAGVGNIVIGILDKKVAMGIDPTVALSHVIANELLTESYEKLLNNMRDWAGRHNADPTVINCFNMDMWKFFSIMKEAQCGLSSFFE